MKFTTLTLSLSALLAVTSTAGAAPLDRAIVVAAVEKAAIRNLPDTVVAVEVHDVYLRGNVDVPDGATVSVRIRADGDEDWIGRFGATALVSIAGRSPVAVALTADVAVYISVPALRVPISRGRALQAVDLSLVQREAGTLPGGIIRDLTLLIGRTPKRDLGLNQVIREGDLEKRVDARRNRSVTLLLNRGALSIAAPAVLRQDAVIGDLVQVLATGTRTLLYGILETPDLVTVSVPARAGDRRRSSSSSSSPAAIAARPEVP